MSKTEPHRLCDPNQTIIMRRDNGDGTFSIWSSAENRVLFGHGNTRREAAKHLAEQLRDLARLVEAQEGSAGTGIPRTMQRCTARWHVGLLDGKLHDGARCGLAKDHEGDHTFVGRSNESKATP